MNPVSPVCVYGKIPAQGDFFRVNASDPPAMALDQFLQESLDHLRNNSAVLPADPTYFLYRAPGSKQCTLGAMVPSQDSVGRQFPLVIFVSLDAAQTAMRFSAVPVAYARFLMEVTNVLGYAQGMSPQQLHDAVRGLTLPGNGELSTADDICRQTLSGTSAMQVQARLFGDLNAGRQYYAFRTFTDACASVRGKEPPKANVTLSCPIAGDVDLFTWLEMARRQLRWAEAPPSFFWNEGALPRLLLPLGPAPASVLLYLAKPDHGGAKLWPLQTERQDAIEMARQALPPAHRRALDEPHSSLEALIASLAS